MEKMAIVWCGELVGYLGAPEGNAGLRSGRWIPANARMTQPFLEAMQRSHRRPHGKEELVEVDVKGEARTATVCIFQAGNMSVQLQEKRITPK